MNIDGIKIGHTYGNGKGVFRKVRRFTNGRGNELKEPYFIEYVKCNENGAVGNQKIYQCWCTTFAGWAKEDRGNVGNLE